jgi:hypothetical protein
MVAAAGASVPSVEHELFGTEAQLASVLIHRRGVVDKLPPIVSRVNVHFDHARVGCDLDVADASIVGRRVGKECRIGCRLRWWRFN